MKFDEFGALVRERLIQRIAKITISSLISTLFITSAGVGIGLVTAPVANAANPTMVSVTKVQNGIAAVKWTDVRSSEPTLIGYSLKYSTNAGGGGGSTFYLSLGLVTEAQVCVSQSGNYDYSIAKVTTGGVIGTYSAAIAKNVSTNASCSGTAYAFTINFFANGGSGSMDSVTGTSSGYVTPASNFTPPANQSFKNWNTASGGGGTTYAPGSVIPITSANQVVNLYAQYNTNYGISSASSSPTASSVATGYTAASTQTTITLNRSGSSGSNPVETITVDAGTWTLVAGSGITLSATSVTSASPITATLTAATGTFTMQLNTGSNAGSYTATLTNATTDPLNYLVTVSNSLPAPNITLSTGTVTGTYNSAISEPVYTVNNYGGNIASFSISPALPTGLSLDTTTGLISGTPTQIVSRTETLTATNATGSSSVAFTLTINKADQTVNWNPTTTIYTNQSPLTPSIAATTTGDGAITYSKVSNTNSSCSVNSSTGVLTYSGAGDCVIRATAASTTNYNTAYLDVTFNISAASIAYTVDSATVSPVSSSVVFGYLGASTQTRVSLTRAGNSGSDPTTTISVNSGSWTITQETSTTITGSPATLTSAASKTITLTAGTGSFLLSLDAGAVVGTYTATVGSTLVTYTVSVTGSAPSVSTPTITGTKKVGETLSASATATAGSPTPTVSYQWFRSTSSDGTYSAISSATNSTYVLTSSDLNNYIKVQATASNGISPNAVDTSTATTQIAAADLAPSVSKPTISGTTKVGEILTASASSTGGSPSPSISYQWFRATTSGGAYSAISGATSATYTLVSADESNYLKVQATASNGVSPDAVDTSTATAQISAADVSYSVSSATSSAGAISSVAYEASDSASQTTITLTRSGNSGSNPTVTISVTGGSWTATQVSGTTISGTSATVTSGSSVTVTLTAATGTLTLSRNASLTLTTETATVNSASALNYAVTVTADTPDAPTVTETTTANVSFIVKWNRPTKIGSGALSSYTLSVSPAPTSGASSFSISPSGGSSESYTVNNLANGTEYTFTITATNNGGKVSNAATTRGKPRTTPGAPTLGTVTPYNETATVTFTAPGSNGGDTITSYTVYATPSSGSVIEITCATSPCTATGLTNGVTYTFTVKAENGAGKGSASAGATGKPVSVPGQPSIVSVTPYNETATVVWSPPANDGGDTITAYTVTATAGAVSKTCTASGNSCTVEGLTNGTTYSFTVKATNGQGNSAASGATTGKPSWVPKAPVAPTVTAYTDTATITWSAPDDNGEAITSYMLESSTAGSGTWYTVLSSTNLTSVEVSGLTGKSDLIYRVSATNSKGRGSNSNSSAPVTPGKSSHSLTLTPSVVRANFESGSGASITTTTSAADFDSFGTSLNASLSYTVSDSDVCQISGTSVIPKTKASGGKSGSCTVTVTSSGNSKYNGANNTFTFTVDPIEPDDPDTSTVTTTSSSIVVNWNALTSTKDGGNGGSGVKGYKLEYSSDSGTTWTTILDTSTALTGTISSLSANTDYKVRLKAINNGDKYSSGREFTVKTSAASKTGRGLGLSGGATINYGQTLTLTKSGSTAGTSRWSTNDSSICTVDDTGTVTSVGAGTCTISFIADEDSTYESGTATTSFTIDAIDPDAPTLGNPSAGEESLTLSWTAPTNKGGAASITGYTVTSSPAGYGCTTTGATTCTITGLNSSTTYTFTITATSSSGKTSVVSGSKSGKPNAKAAGSSSPAPAPVREISPATPAPKEPTKAQPKANEILPAVKIPSNTTLPPAAALPTQGSIPTFKNGKSEVATLTITQEPQKPASTDPSATPPTVVTTAEFKGDNWGVTVQTSNTSTSIATTTGASIAQVVLAKGESAKTKGNGFAAGTIIAVYIFSDPQLIGRVRTDQNGNFAGTIRIPSYLPEGAHTLQLNGRDKNFDIRTASLPIVIRTKPAVARPSAAPVPAPVIQTPAQKEETTFVINFALNSWWVNSAGYNSIRKALDKVPSDAKNLRVTIIGNKQKTRIDPYPNIGLDRARAVMAAMKKLGFKAKYSAVQSVTPGLSSADYRKAEVTISWDPAE